MPSQRTIARRFTERALQLIRVSNGLNAEALDELRKLSGEIRGLLAGAVVAGMPRRELNALLRDLDQVIAGRYDRIRDRQIIAVAEIAATEAAFAARAAELPRRPSRAVLDDIQSRLLVLGTSLADLWGQQRNDLSLRISGAVRQAAAGQADPAQLVPTVTGTGRRRAGGVMQHAERSATTLVETSVNSATSAGRVATLKASGVTHFQWHAVLDERTTAGCALRHGKIYDLDTLQPVGHEIPIERAPPRHYRCLLGGSRVSPCGRITGVSERRYDGDILIFRTASGNELSVTPNHPILTDQGWLPASSINVGSNVVSSGRSEWVFGADADGEHVPPRIEDIARALRGSIDVCSMPVPLSAEDFHGDGVGSKVAVIWADRGLGDRIDAALQQHSPKDRFVVGASDPAGALSRLSALDQAVETVRASTLRGMSGESVCPPLVRGQSGRTQLVGLAAAAQFDSVLSQDAEDGHGRHVECLGKHGGGFPIPVSVDDLGLGQVDASTSNETARLDSAEDDALRDARLADDLRNGSAGPVFLDAVVDKRRISWSGHVYNLETTTGAYVANGIVNHNCRSILLPMAFADDIPVPADGGAETFRQYFDSLDDADQERLFGVGRADLFRRGVITQSDLVNQTGQMLTLAELKALTGD